MDGVDSEWNTGVLGVSGDSVETDSTVENDGVGEGVDRAPISA